MKFACAIPIYHPTDEQLGHVDVYAKIFDQVYIYDNTENGISDEHRAIFKEYGNLTYITNGANDGLSHAYNVMCKKALDAGFAYLAIYDQDSMPNEKYIRKLMQYIEYNREDDVAAYGPKICKVEDDSLAVDEVADVDVLISSGTFIDLNIYNKLPGFDEDFFIDKVDDDYCLMAKEHGYKIKEVRSCLLFHKIGDHKKFLWKTIEQHSPLRMYYIARNTMYLYEKYGRGKWAGWKWLLDRMRHVLLYDDEKIKKLKMMILGARDCQKHSMGKWSERDED